MAKNKLLNVPNLNDGTNFPLSAGPFTNGEVQVWWAPNETPPANLTYIPPTKWLDNKVLRIPRVVRFLNDSHQVVADPSMQYMADRIALGAQETSFPLGNLDTLTIQNSPQDSSRGKYNFAAKTGQPWKIVKVLDDNGTMTTTDYLSGTMTQVAPSNWQTTGLPIPLQVPSPVVTPNPGSTTYITYFYNVTFYLYLAGPGGVFTTTGPFSNAFSSFGP